LEKRKGWPKKEKGKVGGGPYWSTAREEQTQHFIGFEGRGGRIHGRGNQALGKCAWAGDRRVRKRKQRRRRTSIRKGEAATRREGGRGNRTVVSGIRHREKGGQAKGKSDNAFPKKTIGGNLGKDEPINVDWGAEHQVRPGKTDEGWRTSASQKSKR